MNCWLLRVTFWWSHQPLRRRADGRSGRRRRPPKKENEGARKETETLPDTEKRQQQKNNKEWRCALIRNVARQGITAMCYHPCLFVCLCKPPIIGVLEKETESCLKEGPITSSVVDSLCSSPLKYTSIFLACISNFFSPKFDEELLVLLFGLCETKSSPARRK